MALPSSIATFIFFAMALRPALSSRLSSEDIDMEEEMRQAQELGNKYLTEKFAAMPKSTGPTLTAGASLLQTKSHTSKVGKVGKISKAGAGKQQGKKATTPPAFNPFVPDPALARK